MDELEQLKAKIAALQTSPAAPESLASQSPALPNGGLEGDTLSQYLKSNTGPQATIGNNPLNPSLISKPTVAAPVSEEESPESENVAPSRSPSSILAKLQALKSNPTQNPPPVQDVLSKLLGQSKDDLQNEFVRHLSH